MQPYGVCVGARRVRTVQRVPYVPDMNIGRPLFRARPLPAYPVREQHHVMLQDRINQDVQHNIQQDNIAYNRRPYDDPHKPIHSLFAECFRTFGLTAREAHMFVRTRDVQHNDAGCIALLRTKEAAAALLDDGLLCIIRPGCESNNL